MILTLKDRLVIAEGELKLRTGRAYNIQVDDQGQIKDWELTEYKEKSLGKNVLCSQGMNFLLSRNLGIPMAIAVGNGSVSGANAPASTNTSLVSEISNGRFGVRGDQFSRVDNGRITLSALWNRGALGAVSITEWGLFCNETGTPVIGKETGFMIARRAESYIKSDLTKDIEIVWIITLSWS